MLEVGALPWVGALPFGTPRAPGQHLQERGARVSGRLQVALWVWFLVLVQGFSSVSDRASWLQQDGAKVLTNVAHGAARTNLSA